MNLEYWLEQTQLDHFEDAEKKKGENACPTKQLVLKIIMIVWQI